MTTKLPHSRRAAKGGHHEPEAHHQAEVPMPAGESAPATSEADIDEPVHADPWLAKVEADTDRALRAAGDGDMNQAFTWLCMALRSMAAHLPGTRQVADEIRTRKVAIVDGTGKARVLLASDGDKLLQAFRPDGEPVMHLSVPERDWEAPIILNVGPDRGYSATMHGGVADGGLYVNHEGGVLISAAASDNGGPQTEITDEFSSARIRLGCEDGNATIEALHKDTKIEVKASDLYEASIALQTKHGRHEWKADPDGRMTQTSRGPVTRAPSVV